MHKESKAFSSAASAACAAEEARHGISPELMAQLEQLGPEHQAIPQVSALRAAGPSGGKSAGDRREVGEA